MKIDQREFGPQLRAPPFIPSKRTIIKVPGYYAEKKKACTNTSAGQTSGKPLEQGSGTGQEQACNGDEGYMGHINSPLMCNRFSGVNCSAETEDPQSYPANAVIEAAFKSPNDVHTVQENIDEEFCMEKECDSATELINDSSSRDHLKDINP